MTTFLETVGPAIGRASWQGAVLALVVAGLVRCCGERLSPRWRFLLWGIVVLRLLVVVTPASSWSVFNLSDWDRPREVVTTETRVKLTPAPVAPLVSNAPPIIIRSEPEFAPISEPPQAATPPEVPRETPPVIAASALPVEVESPARSHLDATLVAHVLTGVWLAGCIAMLMVLLRTALCLRRRLALCQPVRDSFLLALLDECRQTLRLKQTPQLLVTPDSFGPCVVGTWHPRIVLPEQVVTQSSPERLRHILAHELAHVARGDLLTNWLLLAVRVLHWFNPLAWLTIREMQAERESACDELAFATLGSTDRTAYAATLLEVAAGLTPTPLAPGLIGFSSSRFRLKTRIERLLQSALVTRLRNPLCVVLWLAVALLGLTDGMPDAKGEPPQQAEIAPVATNADSNARARNTPPLAVAPFTESVAHDHQRAWASSLESDIEIRNSVGMKLCLIPPGEFLMGSPETDSHHEKSEEQHLAKVTSPFYLGKYEVTHGEWKAVMGTEPWAGKKHVQQGVDFPVSYVSWEDAVEFCRKLSLKEKATYRLPSETEWEYACRAGTTTPFSFGDKTTDLHNYAWFDQNAGRSKESDWFAHRVGQKRANPFGLHDMHGNLWEWCQDEFEFHYSKRRPTSATPQPGADFVRRGGCFADPSHSSRSAMRFAGGPKEKNLFVGFRVIREASATGKGRAAAANPVRVSITGHCTNIATKAAMPGVSVRLYRCEGRTSPPVEIARTISGTDGSFSFEGFVPPRPWNHLDRLVYGCLGVSDEGLVGTTSVMQIMHMPEKRLEEHTSIQLSRESSTMTGQVLNSRGLPVAGAKILPCSVDDRPVADLRSVTTDAEGRFKLDKVAVGTNRRTNDKRLMSQCRVQHPDYPETFIKAVSLPGDITVTFPAGCVVTGSVVDSVTGKPAAGAVVTARQLRTHRCATTNAAGQFRFVLEDGTYDFLADAPERVCAAVAGLDCAAGKPVELPPFRLIAGGFITGQVVVKETGKPITISERGQPLMVGLFGPSQTATQLLFPTSLVPLDSEGRFRLRAAPGKNFPYIHNAETDSPHSIRNAQNQSPVVVKEGQTATCQLHMLQRLPYDPGREANTALEKIQKFIADLPQDPLERTRAIIVEVRKHPHHNSQPETWGSLIRELVRIGPAAVPLLCDELDHSNRREEQLRALNVREDEIASARQWEENPLLRFYGFTLRAIGDKRAVPALIRAIPRTLIESGSDCGYTVKDKELMDFMLDHDLYEHERNHFGYGRPYREITGAIKLLTGQDFDTFDLNWIDRRQDPRRLALQQLAFQRLSQRYQEWWEANAAKLTSDSVYHKVNLRLIKELPPTNEPAPVREGTHTRPSFSGLVVSPPDHSGPYISHFYDLDTMLNRAWPENIPNNASSLDKKIFTFWTSQNGLDVMCVRHRTADGKEFCVLRSLGMQVRELTPAEHGQLGTLLAAGKLPEGRPVTGDLLIHVDEKTKQADPAAPAIFLYLTREGTRGVIQVQSQSRAGVTVGLCEIQP